MRLYHRVKSFMKSLISKMGFFFAGKLLKKRLVFAFIVLNHRSMRLSVSFTSSEALLFPLFQMF